LDVTNTSLGSLFPIISQFIGLQQPFLSLLPRLPVVVLFFFRLCVGMEKLWKAFLEKDATISFFFD
jgi:hypothetical protein